jgi:transposase-like protein
MKTQQYQRSFHVVKNLEEELRETIHAQLRGATLGMIKNLFDEEVGALCGNRFSRKGGDLCHRTGSDPGSVIVGGQRVRVNKPRLRKAGREIGLQTYSALQNFDMLGERVMNHMLSGVSTRNYEPLLDEMEGGLGLKKSTVSSAFVKGSQKILDEMNSRDLSAMEFCSIMVDGVGFGSRTVITALGIKLDGKKLILGLREGDTENSEVVKDLFRNLIDRGLRVNVNYLFVIDGSKALKKAIQKVFGTHTPIQRCVRHKERNIIQYLDKQHHAEFQRRWKKLHGYVNYDAALAEYKMLEHWLSQINHAALNSLQEAEMETLTVIKLKVGALLRKSLLSTNPIESAFSKTKGKTGRVRNWKSSPDQVSRWAASALALVEKQFRIVKGFREIPALIEELKNYSLEKESKAA